MWATTPSHELIFDKAKKNRWRKDSLVNNFVSKQLDICVLKVNWHKIYVLYKRTTSKQISVNVENKTSWSTESIYEWVKQGIIGAGKNSSLANSTCFCWHVQVPAPIKRLTTICISSPRDSNIIFWTPQSLRGCATAWSQIDVDRLRRLLRLWWTLRSGQSLMALSVSVVCLILRNHVEARGLRSDWGEQDIVLLWYRWLQIHG